jgi:hypothetical protein
VVLVWNIPTPYFLEYLVIRLASVWPLSVQRSRIDVHHAYICYGTHPGLITMLFLERGRR